MYLVELLRGVLGVVCIRPFKGAQWHLVRALDSSSYYHHNHYAVTLKSDKSDAVRTFLTL